MMRDTKKQLRDKVVAIGNKLKAYDFKLELSTAQLTSEREIRKRAKVLAKLA